MFDRKTFKKQWDKERRDHNNRLVKRWKLMKGCAVCGYKKHPAALVMDHIDPTTKCPTLSNHRRSYNPAWSKDRLKQEMAKCQVLCANCHQVRTFDEGHHWNTMNTSYGGEIVSTGLQVQKWTTRQE